MTRIVEKQRHRSNHPCSSSSDYWKSSLVIPYLDSLVSSLQQRFSDSHAPAFSLTILHPANMLKMTSDEFKTRSKEFSEYYFLPDFDSEAELWYNLWNDKKLTKELSKELNLVDLIQEAETFYPAFTLLNALLIAITQPCTTCTIERSFSTLRRVKTWLRSTMTGNRLNGLCMLSVHRKIVLKKAEYYEKETLQRFASNPRKMMLTV